jgi:hypothetical protein
MQSSADLLKQKESSLPEEVRKEIIRRAEETGNEIFIIGADLYNSEGPIYTSKWLWQQDYLSLVAKAVAMIIIDHAYGKKTKAWPSQETIARELGNCISVRTIQRGIDELCGNNPKSIRIFEKVRRGQGKTNIYVVLFRGSDFSYTLKDLPDATN